MKKVINDCKVCKVFSAQPYGPAATAPLLSFRTEGGRPFVTTGIDFAVPTRSQRGSNANATC